jgi:hypothetical protein
MNLEGFDNIYLKTFNYTLSAYSAKYFLNKGVKQSFIHYQQILVKAGMFGSGIRMTA